MRDSNHESQTKFFERLIKEQLDKHKFIVTSLEVTVLRRPSSFRKETFLTEYRVFVRKRLNGHLAYIQLKYSQEVFANGAVCPGYIAYNDIKRKFKEVSHGRS